MAKFVKAKNCSACPYRSYSLSKLKEKDVDLIQNSCLIVMFKRGENICKQGTEVTHALYLAKGSVKLYIEGKNKNLILKIINERKYIGLQSLFGGGIYNYTVTALEDVQVCMINANIILDLAKKNAEYLFELTKTLSDSTNFVYKKIFDINQKQLRGRLADVLLYFSEEIYKNSIFELKLNRRELAEFSAMSMENAVRILAEYRKDGIIELDGRKFTIKQPDILRKIGELG
ncbi:MAG: Crp/Fnr family transcriptional regulator [Bacteroidales bacterium]|nr:Crp/Fnr family transcriptional regulator [Bacteroidales bacterium]MBN2758460.1 Crp/Fnr family transcriptional regulator [Bacteroidales bacterium]